MNFDRNSGVCGMSVDNIFSSEMYHNEQWCMTHSGNVISIKCFKNYLANERT